MNTKENLVKLARLIDEREHEMDADDLSLFNGQCGMALYYFYMGTYLEDARLLRKGRGLLEKLSDRIAGGEMHFRIFHAFSYGLAGLAYTFWHLREEGFIGDEDAIAFDGIEQMLVDCCRSDFSRNISDNLHGPMGVVYYLNRTIGNPASRKAIEEIVGMYHEHAVKDDYGLRIKNMIVKETHEKEYNMSLSHGLSGNLSILADACAKGLEVPLMEEIMKGGVRYIHHTEVSETEPGVTNSFFPSYLSEHEGFSIEANKGHYKTRLAWCYGDLNMSFLFFRLARIYGRQDYYDKAVAIARNTLHRKTRNEAQVADIYFCHGSAGLAYLYLRIYEITGEDCFRQQSEHWYAMTDERLDSSIAQFTADSPFSLLEGYPGVALTYLSRMLGKGLAWSDIFFLNF
ncbi:MAG: lanthionine synthetase LanC family protein [Chitinophaga sp.]